MYQNVADPGASFANYAQRWPTPPVDVLHSEQPPSPIPEVEGSSFSGLHCVYTRAMFAHAIP